MRNQPQQAILFQLVFAVVPTLVELFITATVLTQRCGEKYALATLATFVAYCAYTSWITEWRMKIRRNLVRDRARERNNCCMFQDTEFFQHSQ
jgi:ABC-type transport system involved in Fe-S cluster assembly fused permease/ATPase subunit